MLAEWTAWQAPTRKRVLPQFGRPEVKPEAVALPALREDTHTFFHAPNSLSSEHDQLPLKKILTADFPSPDAFNRRKRGAETAAMVAWHESQDWLASGDLWQCALVPSGQLVLDRYFTPPRLFFSLKVTDRGVLGWSVHRVGENYCKLSDEHATYSWHRIMDLRKVFVIETTPIPPSHCFIQNACAMPDLGIILKHKAPCGIVAMVSLSRLRWHPRAGHEEARCCRGRRCRQH